MDRFMANVRTGMASLIEQRSRALLSSLGIAVGSLAILLLVSIAVGVRADVTREVDGIGVNLLIVIPGRIEEGSMFPSGMLGISQIKDEDVARVAQVPGVRRAVPITFVGTGINSKDAKSGLTLVVATEPGFFQARSSKFREGRPLASGDSRARVCVLGSVAADRLFPGRSALGESVRHGGVEYQVVGVTADPGTSGGMLSQGGFENMAMVPYELIRRAETASQIDRIFIQTEPNREPKSLVAQVDRALGQRLERDSYSVLTQQDLLQLVFKVMTILTTLLAGLTSIALLVGGVGILTVMLMSVQERTREIGIRKAFGARRSDIFFQFLSEAAVLSTLGGLAGLAISAATAWGLARFTAIKPILNLPIVGLAMGVCLAVGVVFGLLPALKASNRDPVQSLRLE
jgi:putative ABC transport system permease protein